MRYRNPTIIAALGLLLAAATIIGCATLQPGADPVAVRTQQTLATGQYVYDWGMKWCSANAANLSPAGLELANKIRTDFPPSYRALDTSLDTYKAGKAGDLDAALTHFTDLVGQLEALVKSFGGPDLRAAATAAVGKGGTS